MSDTDQSAPAEAGRRGSPPVVAEVLRLANRTHNLTVASERTDLAARIEAEAATWRDTEMRVVIAGEIKRGKSSIINALLDQPGLLPVDADVATSVHLAVRHAERLRIEVVRQRDGAGEERTEIQPDQLAAHASMQGSAADREGVVGVEIGLPHPLLERGLVLIDTPGVGGLTRGHRDAALVALRRADALLFAVSVEEPIGLSELRFLAEASERIDNVVMLLTKIDSSADPDRMRDEDRAKMRTHLDNLRAAAAGDEADEDLREAARRFERIVEAPFLGVSSRLADKARARLEAGRTDAAATLRQRSGLGALDAVFDRALQNRELIRMANILRVVSHVLARIESEQSAQARVVAGDGAEVEEEMRARLGELEALLPAQARWRQRLGGSVQRIQADLNRTIGREVSRIDRVYREHIDAAGKNVDPVMANLSTDLEQSINAAWATVTATLTASFDDAVGRLAEEFSLQDVLFDMGRADLPDLLHQLDIGQRRDTNAGKANFADDGLPTLLTAGVGGSMVAGVAGLLGAAVAAPLLPGLLVAAPIGYVRYRKRHQVQVRQDYLRVVREVVAQVRQEFQAELTLKIIEARERVEATIEEAIASRKREIEEQRREVQQILRESQAERAERQAHVERELAAARGLRAEAERLQSEIDAVLRAS